MCDPETRKNCATLKESLMDIDSNFEDDYKSVNDLKPKKKKEKPEIKCKKKKVTFDCVDDDNSFNEETFDYEYDDENMSEEENSDDDLIDENMFDEECEEENLTDEECKDKLISDEECEDENMSIEESFDYDCEQENKSIDKNCSDSEYDESLMDNGINNYKSKYLKEDIYGRIRKPDGSTVVNYLFYNDLINFFSSN